VVYGAPFDLAGSRQRLTAGTTFTLRPDEELRIGGTPHGVRAYLCVRGGLQAPEVLGSRSGLAPLGAGAELECTPGSIHGRFVRIPHDAASGPESTRLRVLPGPQAGWFRAEEWYGRPGDSPPPTFTVRPESNRMGLRLLGPPLTLPERELVSEPVCPGTVQVTRDGQCILLGVDGQTIGGYPKVAQVISADQDALGQLRPGARVCFEGVRLDEAEALYRRRQALLRAWLRRLRTAAVFGS
jgi:antagonist of KipI